jgi:hypothetical protein
MATQMHTVDWYDEMQLSLQSTSNRPEGTVVRLGKPVTPHSHDLAEILTDRVRPATEWVGRGAVTCQLPCHCSTYVGRQAGDQRTRDWPLPA